MLHHSHLNSQFPATNETKAIGKLNLLVMWCVIQWYCYCVHKTMEIIISKYEKQSRVLACVVWSEASNWHSDDVCCAGTDGMMLRSISFFSSEKKKQWNEIWILMSLFIFHTSYSTSIRIPSSFPEPSNISFCCTKKPHKYWYSLKTMLMLLQMQWLCMIPSSLPRYAVWWEWELSTAKNAITFIAGNAKSGEN